MTRLAVLLPLALVAGCSSRDDEVGGVSPDEDRLLNQAASTLGDNYMAAPDNEFVVNMAAGNEATANTTEMGNAQ